MRTLIMLLLCCLLVPTAATADRYYRDGSRHHGRYYSSDSYGPGHRYHPRYTHRRHHENEWLVPLAIVGGLVGIVALSEMNRPPPPPPPPQRICRDTYNHYDEYGRYLYSRYVDRPCY